MIHHPVWFPVIVAASDEDRQHCQPLTTVSSATRRAFDGLVLDSGVAFDGVAFDA